MKIALLYIAITVLGMALLYSCDEDGRLVDNSVNNSSIYAVGSNESQAVKLIKVSTGELWSGDIFYDNNGEKLPAAVSQIRRHGNSLYLFIPDAHKIFIIHNTTFKKLAEIDFSADGLNPIDFGVANPTTAYICFNNSNILKKLDLTNNEMTISVKIGANSSAIDCFGNQVYIANRDDNTVSVVDSRTDEEEAIIPVAPCPIFLKISPDGERVIVVSAGDGKLNDKTKSAAKVSIINLQSRIVEKTFDLGNSSAKAIEQIPLALALTKSDMAFVQTQEYLWNFNYRYSGQIMLVNKVKYLDLLYDEINENLMALEDNNGRRLINADNQTGSSKSSITLPGDIVKLFLP